ncbi:MAG: 2Fe-2S iron-sulfur cluster-binding protein [Bacteroidota bacterium]
MKNFFPLSIKEVIRETPQAVSLVFEVPEELKTGFSFQAGQYITIKTKVDGKEIRRAYSLCSHPSSDTLKVTVKEIEGGKFSAIANRQLKAGDVLEVHPPEGKFIFEPEAANKDRTYVAFAAGSGITPILSIVKTILNEDLENKFFLVYGNRTPEETIFFEELLELQSKHPDRFHIQFVYSRKKEEGFAYGRIGASSVNTVLRETNKYKACGKFFLCGPEEMVHNVKAELLNNNIEEERIAFELFKSSDQGEVKSEIDGFADVSIQIDGEETSFRMETTSTVMDSALDLGMDLPYSCQGGTCSSCVARLKEGKVTMKKNLSLTDSEVEEGLILTCQAIPGSSTLLLNYDEV